ncbi:CRISPR-associated protein Cse3, partial [Carbonactinospora thermoautotrophica]
FPQVSDGRPARQAHGVLWRLDESAGGFVLYVQSRTRPDWSKLPEGYLAAPAQVRDLAPVLDAVTPGRKLAFRLVANATRTIHPDGVPGQRGQGKRVPHRHPDKQIEWLAAQGARHGFVLPLAANGQPDVAPSPRPILRGDRRGGKPIVIEPVRYDGHLVVTDPDALRAALTLGVGRAKAYGCGLLSLAPPRG